ncbi:MAG: hypothetical protein V1789_10490 [PVC group bacterium]
MLYLFILRFNQARNNFRGLLKTGRLRLFIGLFVLLVVWAGLFGGFYRAFTFLQTFLGVGQVLIERLIYLLTFALFIMLIFSNAAVSFQLHFKALETGYLHTLPLPPGAVYWFLLLEGAVLSTWATIFLIFPVVLAYSLTHGISLAACLLLLLFAAGLSSLAALIGALIAALIPRLLAPGKTRAAVIAAVVIVALAIPFRRALSPGSPPAPDRTTLMVNRLLEHSRATLSPILPGYWAAEGFIQAAGGRFRRSLGFLAVLAVNALLAAQIVELTAERSYPETWSLYHSRGPRRRKGKAAREDKNIVTSQNLRGPTARIEVGNLSHNLPGRIEVENLSHNLPGRIKVENLSHRMPGPLSCLPSPARALLVKDVKTFFRDPAQWLQTAILFGLLAIYIVNIRNMPRNVYQPFWKSLITFFNLGAASLVLATLTTRFIYPSFSLEGRTFWVLGLAPIPRRTIFRVKFGGGFIAALLITEPLMLLSNHILEVSGTMTLVTCGAIFLMAGVLVSLATGMGAIFPDFNQDNPARIASGFGGTLNLVLSLIYISLTVGALALAYHFRELIKLPIAASAVCFVLSLSALGIYLPIKLGIRAIERCEF